MDAEQETRELDITVRQYVYDQVIHTGLMPTINETASAISRTPNEVRSSFHRLGEAHMLVLQKGSGEILMANPFSAVPTPFLVRAAGRSYYGNCIWDALGIPAMLNEDAVIEASCGCCGTAMNLAVSNGSLDEPQRRGIAHFAIPAAHWWDDIVFN